MKKREKKTNEIIKFLSFIKYEKKKKTCSHQEKKYLMDVVYFIRKKEKRNVN